MQNKAVQIFERWLGWGLPIVVVMVGVCMCWVDRPFARWMLDLNTHPGKGTLTTGLAIWLTHLVYIGMACVFVLCFWMRWRRPRCHFSDCLSLLSTSLAFTFFMKMVLQFVFGRYVPRYGGSSTLLFVRNPHLYGFHWLQMGSFPSGHMAMLSTTAVAVCLYYPILKWPSILAGFVLAFALLFWNFHFLSDVIAGAYLGALMTLAVYMSIERRNVL